MVDDEENAISASPFSIINAYEGGEQGFKVENPLHIDNIPVANLVVIEVEGQHVLDPKSIDVYDICVKIWDYIQLFGAILILIGMFGGVLLFAIWGFNPTIFGKSMDD
jgi:hypothetical protein